MKLKLRSSVSVVERKDNIIEFFKTNTREQVLIKVHNPVIKDFLQQLNGEVTLAELVETQKLYDIQEELKDFVEYLQNKGILSNIADLDSEEYSIYRRTIHLLEDYSTSHTHLKEMWINIHQSTVVVIGLGAVGTWVAYNLIQSGIQNLVLIDNDTIEITNLHRQVGYHESDIGKLKTEVLKERLLEKNPSANIYLINKQLDENLLSDALTKNVDLIINCADYPNVDATSLWVGKYGMKNKIPHIVGGGYNMHLSLIGQTIIPFNTACIKCFEKQLIQINKIDPNSVRKLAVKNRKVGSFGPMCAIIASFIGIEAIKVLSKSIQPANINRRGEFNIYNMGVTYKEFPRLEDCEWCGKE